ncbi:MAG: hypothetical protein WA359_02270 [Acidimicrobiales bacterium]
MTYGSGARRGLAVIAATSLMVIGWQTAAIASVRSTAFAFGHLSANELGPNHLKIRIRAVSSSRSLTTATTTATVQREPRTSEPGVNTTTADGFRFRVQANKPSLSTTEGHKKDQGTPPAIAPPGKDYVQIPLTITNLQSDRPLSLLDVLLGPLQYGAYPNPGFTSGAVEGDFSIDLPPKDEGGCASMLGTLVNGVCQNAAYIVLSNGSDAESEAGIQASPNIRPGKSTKVTLYFGPVSAHTLLSTVTAFVRTGYSTEYGNGIFKTKSIPLPK